MTHSKWYTKTKIITPWTTVKHEASMRFYNMHESLAKCVDNLNSEQELIKKNKEKIKSKKNLLSQISITK
ncbi:MAG: hypothetical protein U0T81_16845 [Saprospiraceae bacterium]